MPGAEDMSCECECEWRASSSNGMWWFGKWNQSQLGTSGTRGVWGEQGAEGEEEENQVQPKNCPGLPSRAPGDPNPNHKTLTLP